MYIFFTFCSKINEFERKKSEKNEKIPKIRAFKVDYFNFYVKKLNN